MKSSEFLKENANMGMPDESEAIAQLSTLPQPIGINGGGYTYYVDVTKQPLRFKASDGSELRQAKTLHDIAGWMDNKSEWLAFLNDEEDLKFLVDYDIVRPYKKRNDRYSDQEYHELKQRDLVAEGHNESKAIALLATLPQPIGINGGWYTYRVDVTKRPLVFTASDGGILKNAKSLHDITELMDNQDDWLSFLDRNTDQEEMQYLIEIGLIRPFKKRTGPETDQEDHEIHAHGLREDASAGATASGSVAAVVGQLGGSTKDLIKRQKNYTNQQTAGGIIKGVKAAKVK